MLALVPVVPLVVLVASLTVELVEVEVEVEVVLVASLTVELVELLELLEVGVVLAVSLTVELVELGVVVCDAPPPPPQAVKAATRTIEPVWRNMGNLQR